MKRNFTNVMRYCMDELLPLAIRDNYYFMYPFYRYWFNGSENLGSIMRFKEIVHSMSDQEFTTFYETLKCRANIRPTDCSEDLVWTLRVATSTQRQLPSRKPSMFKATLNSYRLWISHSMSSAVFTRWSMSGG